MIRASGRDFNGLLDSPCYQRGEMSCLSCHQMHQPAGDPRSREDWANNQLKLGMGGNSACVQCHDRFSDEERLTRHTHHAADSGGSNCYNCHMPYVTYGILKAIRSHQIQSPSVAKSVETGRPNGCNQCHQDKTLAWTADNLARWYGVPKPTLSADEQQVAATVLWALRGDAGQRALMAWSYGWEEGRAAAGSHWQAPYLAQLLEDRYDAVRIIADRSLRRSPAFRDVAYDPVGPPEQRTAAHQRVLEIWAGGQDPHKHPFAREVLIDEEGHVREAEFRRVWGQRDDRPMSVRE
jgi:Cytochrome c552